MTIDKCPDCGQFVFVSMAHECDPVFYVIEERDYDDSKWKEEYMTTVRAENANEAAEKYAYDYLTEDYSPSVTGVDVVVECLNGTVKKFEVGSEIVLQVSAEEVEYTGPFAKLLSEYPECEDYDGYDNGTCEHTDGACRDRIETDVDDMHSELAGKFTKLEILEFLHREQTSSNHNSISGLCEWLEHGSVQYTEVKVMEVAA